VTDAALPGALSRARIFFSGHSLLDNPLPDFVVEIARSQGQDIGWNQQNVSGSLLRTRTWGEGEWAGYGQGKNRSGTGMDVLQELRSPSTLGPGERYDTLLITERHDILWTLLHENTVGYLRHFHDRFIEGNPEGRTYFSHTWLDIDKARPAAWIAYEKSALAAWECAAARVNLALEAEGRSDRVVPLPGGAALVSLVEQVLAGRVRGLQGSQQERLDALFIDNVHLTPLGMYFMAAVHYAAVFRRSPVGAAGPAGVSPDTVEDLQTLAWRSLGSYYAQPRSRSMDECRQRLSQDVCPGFWAMTAASHPLPIWKQLLAPVVHARRVSACRRVLDDARAEGNPFRWPDPDAQALGLP
jgi:hypothetical protein